MLRRAPSVGPSGYQRWRGGEAGACTESLGSDSGDVGCDAAEIDHFFPPPVPPAAGGGGPDDAAALCGAEDAGAENRVEAAPEKRRPRGGRGFPPPMPRASGPLFLRAERRGGRLILTEVRAQERGRRVVFRADRDGGRLRLRFANDNDDDDDGEPEAGGAAGAGATTGGGVASVAVQHSGAGGGELCQVAAGRRGVEIGAAMMGTTI